MLKKIILIFFLFSSLLVYTTIYAARGNPRIGKKIFVFLRCNECHGTTAQTQKKLMTKGTPLIGNPNKRSAGFIEMYLTDPVRVRATDAIMRKSVGKYKDHMSKPMITRNERDHLIAYILSL